MQFNSENVRVTPFEFQIRTMVDCDSAYMQDRIISEILVNGKPAGPYATMRVGDEQTLPSELIDEVGPMVERMAIDEFMGLGYRERVSELEAQLLILEHHINRVRWWQLRRLWAARKQEV